MKILKSILNCLVFLLTGKGKVAEEMIDEGLLISVEENDTLYIRSLNKTEQKKLKIKIA